MILVSRYGFDTTKNPPIYTDHVYKRVDGVLEHLIDGQARAMVAAEHVQDYVDFQVSQKNLSEKEAQSILQNFLNVRMTTQAFLTEEP